MAKKETKETKETEAVPQPDAAAACFARKRAELEARRAASK